MLKITPLILTYEKWYFPVRDAVRTALSPSRRCFPCGIALELRPRVPATGPQNSSKVPKVVRRGCKKVFWTQGAKVLLHWCKRELHRCKTGLGWCKRLLGDLCSLGPNHLLHPLLIRRFPMEPFLGTLEGH